MAVPTRLPLKRVPAHVPGTASGFQVHELKKSASEVAVVDGVVVVVALKSNDTGEGRLTTDAWIGI